MRDICTKLSIERATPHDLRRTHGSTITAMGFGRDAMNRIQNHREGGIADVYDRHHYEAETKQVLLARSARVPQGLSNRSGSFATLAAMRRALSRVSCLVAISVLAMSRDQPL
jgi:hypothetical protein